MVFITEVHMVGGHEHEHIADVKWKDPSDGKTGESARQTIVDWLNKGNIARVTDGRDTVNVEVYKTHWLRTRADGIWKDNLLALPRY